MSSHYCSYALGQCPFGNKVTECAKRNPEECRACRQANQEETADDKK